MNGYPFWDPRSGFIGGSMCGIIVLLIITLTVHAFAAGMPIPGKTGVGVVVAKKHHSRYPIIRKQYER